MNKFINIDSKKVPFTQGQTIIEAALAAGVYIPHLCYNPEFKPHGSCRLCTVKINGRQVAACTTLASNGAEVENETDEIKNDRSNILKLLFVEGNHICPACEKSGSCQLQATAYYYGVIAPEYTYLYPKRQLDASHPDFVIDFNRCILCELCARASTAVDQKNIFALSGRGIDSHLIINSKNNQLGETDFSQNDKAAHVCPVGAILPKHKGYQVPIGSRLYDQQAINVVGDVAENETKSK